MTSAPTTTAEPASAPTVPSSVTTLGALLPTAARRFPRRTALIVEQESFTFAELDSLSSQVAHGLVSVGVGAGDRVTVYGPNCWQWVVGYYAVAKTGAVVNPISSMLTPDEVRYVVADSGARVLLTSVDKALPLMGLLEADDLSHLVAWGGEAPDGATSFDRWLETEERSFSAAAREPGDLGAVCYTSGTTGHPKGAMQSHRSIVGAAAGTVLMGARGPDDRVVNSLPLAHVYGSCVLNGAVLAGSTLVMVPRFEETAVFAAIREHRATLMDGVPTAYYYLLAHPDFDGADLSSLTRCWVGGQTLPSAKALEFTARSGCPVHEVWGMTELAGAASANPVVGPNKPGTIGVAFPGNAMRIVDIDDPSVALGPGERGELMFRGPLVMDGYYGNEAATRATIEPDGWLHSGDIATMDDDGYFTIVDRKTDMILTAGFNVYPAEVERVLCMHSAVALAAVTGVPDEVKGELAKAYVMLKPGASVSAADLVAHCREHLAAYKLPRAVQFVDEVPITASGKILRRLLKDYDDGTR